MNLPAGTCSLTAGKADANKAGMIRAVGLLLSALFLVVATSRSATFKIPEDKPVVTITLPDAWKPEKIAKGVQGQTSDDAIYFAAELTRNEQGMNSIIDEMSKMLREQKVSLDHGSKKENRYQLNGFAADETSYDGSGADGPESVKVTFVSIDKDTVLVLTFWASLKLAKDHDKEVRAIMQSIKAVK